MKDLKETLDAFSRFGYGWFIKLWLPYGLLAVLTGVFVAVLLMSCVSTFFPLLRWWGLTDEWAVAMEMVEPDMLSTSLAAVLLLALFPASWIAHRAMAKVLMPYPARELRGRRRAQRLLMAAGIMGVVLIFTWLPVLTLVLGADAMAISEVWDDAVTTPVWVWVSAFLVATIATFLCEWAMTLCRLMFKILPTREDKQE